MAFHSLIDPRYEQSDYFPIDLSVDNPYWNQHDVGNIEIFEDYLEQQRAKTGKCIAYGGYQEQRALYQKSPRFQEGVIRDVHMGLDLWAPVGTTVHALMDGTVHSFALNDDPGNYGPTLILEHDWKGQKIYSLYGHLSVKDLERWRVGSRFRESEIIAHLGPATENGGYAPHLHFQVMRDMQNYQGDFPGVVARDEVTDYEALILDPMPFLFGTEN